MPTIPENINGVTVGFGENVVKTIDQKVMDALQLIINSDVASGHVLVSIYISSAKDQHPQTSRHMMGDGKAVDISRINDMRISMHYPSDPTVKSIVDAIQDKFELYPHRRENFGPSIKKKLGNNFNISGHHDHIHISVN